MGCFWKRDETLVSERRAGGELCEQSVHRTNNMTQVMIRTQASKPIWIIHYIATQRNERETTSPPPKFILELETCKPESITMRNVTGKVYNIRLVVARGGTHIPANQVEHNN